MTDTIWIDKELAEMRLGYSSTTIFNSTTFDGYVSLGKTARAPSLNLLIVHAFSLTVVESRPSQIQIFHCFETNTEKENYMICKVLEVMTPARFFDLLCDVEKRGIAEGKSTARGEIRHALGITYGF
jgi:hypothetical protein